MEGAANTIDAGAAAPLLVEARQLEGEARRHKRAIAEHRRQLQDVRARQADIARQCAGLGIEVTYEPSNHPGEGNTPWPNRSSTSRR